MTTTDIRLVSQPVGFDPAIPCSHSCRFAGVRNPRQKARITTGQIAPAMSVSGRNSAFGAVLQAYTCASVHPMTNALALRPWPQPRAICNAAMTPGWRRVPAARPSLSWRAGVLISRVRVAPVARPCRVAVASAWRRRSIPSRMGIPAMT